MQKHRPSGFWAVVCLAFALNPDSGRSQTTTGDAAAGQALYQARGCGGCHGVPPGVATPAIRNAAHAGRIVGLAISRGMAGYNGNSFTIAQQNDLAAYIGTGITGSQSANVGFDTATTFALDNIHLGSTFGAYSTVQLVNAPAQGVVTFSSSNATYTPQTGQCGPASFTWRASGTFGGITYTSNVRSVSLNVANPPPPDLSANPASISGGFGNEFNYQLVAANATARAVTGALPPGLLFDNFQGRITGTPSAMGTYVVTATASNCADGNPTGQTASKTLSITIGQGTQTIVFGALNDKLATDPPFTVSALGGNSGNPVVVTATGVCSSSGTNGTLITLSGSAGVCTLTANQAGNTNFLAAPTVIRQLTVAPNDAEVFPPNCAVPPGWVIPYSADPTAYDPWVATNESGAAFEGICALAVTRPFRFPPDQYSRVAELRFTAQFDAGTIRFRRKVSSLAGYECFRFSIDGVEQDVSGSCYTGTGASGSLPYTEVAIPIGAGVHTLKWEMAPGPFGNYSDSRAWIDGVVLPLSTTITSAATLSATFGQPVTYAITATNFPAAFSVANLPPGLTFQSATGMIYGTPEAAGSMSFTVTAHNPGGANPAASASRFVTLNVAKLSQTIAFAPLPNVNAGSMPFTLNATGGASGNPVTFTATGSCSVSSGVVTPGAAAGTCTITADQSGSGNFEAAPPVTRNFSVLATIPGSPTLTAAVPGNTQVRLEFSPPAFDGGSAIQSYIATCGTVSSTGSQSPLLLLGLVNGVEVACRVVAKNAVGNSAASNTLRVTPANLAFTGTAFSRMSHGNPARDIDLPVPPDGSGQSPAVESRLPYGGYRIHFEMSGPVAQPGTLTVTDAQGQPLAGASATPEGNDVVVALPISVGRVHIALAGINGTASANATIDLIPADSTHSRRVNSADIAAIKARAGQSGNSNLLRFDLNRDGIIDARDTALAKSRSANP